MSNNSSVCCQSSQLIPAMTADVPFFSLNKHLLVGSFNYTPEDHKP